LSDAVVRDREDLGRVPDSCQQIIVNKLDSLIKADVPVICFLSCGARMGYDPAPVFLTREIASVGELKSQDS